MTLDTLPLGQYVKGAMFGIAAVSIWAGWIVVTRLGVTTGLSVWDIAAMRFVTAGLILTPVLMKKGLAYDRLGWKGLMAIAIGGGALMVAFVAAGTTFAPAAHGGALFPGVMPVFVALLATAILGEPFPIPKKLGLVGISAGVVVIVGPGIFSVDQQTVGHMLFLSAALIWAGYTVAMRFGRLDGLHAAAIAAVASMLIYLPVYALLLEDGLFDNPMPVLAFQAFYQGILTMIISFYFYGNAVRILGASNGAAFGALGPVIVALLAIPILGEFPSLTDWLGISFIAGGVYLASGAPLPGSTFS
jgi:drug/metabolite transporter (DMT)-like permease